MSCPCISLTYEINNVPTTEELQSQGLYNGLSYYTFTVSGTDYFIWFNDLGGGTGQWLITEILGDVPNSISGTKQIATQPCPPLGAGGQGIWELPSQLAPYDGYYFGSCVVDCNCINLTVQADGFAQESITALTQQLYNGKKWWIFNYNTYTFYIWFDANGAWIISSTLGGGTIYGRLATNIDCPLAELGDQSGVNWIMDTNYLPNPLLFTTIAVDCPNPCECITFEYVNKSDGSTVSVDVTEPTGAWNGYNYWQIPHAQDAGKCFYMVLTIDNNGCCQWKIYYDECDSTNPENGTFIANLGVANCVDDCDECPFGLWSVKNDQNILLSVTTVDCTNNDCVYIQDRIEKSYSAIQFPIVFEEQNRGWQFGCCESFLVLADPTSSDSWKNDVNSAWCKLSDPNDSVNFKLYKNGNPTTYQPSPVPFVNEPDAYYATIQWIDVLNSEGIGCYTWIIEYNISGVIGQFNWGVYNLKQYSVENAEQTARVRVKFNLIQAIEGINFSQSNVEDSLRFFGFIGERQPNMEIDNLIYQNRTMESVIRQNLNEYTITTDPTGEDITRKLVDLYLLSENEMFISDYNISNHSYRYNDLPVIVEQSPELNYIDLNQRKAIVTCIVGDRTKNKRTFY